MALIAEGLLLLLLDNDSARPSLSRFRVDSVLAAAVLLDLAYACRVRPAFPDEPLPSERLIALQGPVPLDPVVRPALSLLEQGPITPADAIATLSMDTNNIVLGQLLRTGQIRQIQTPPQRFQRSRYIWPIHNRAQVDNIRSAVLGTLFHAQKPDPPIAAIIALLQTIDGFDAVLDVNESDFQRIHSSINNVMCNTWVDTTQITHINLATTGPHILAALRTLPRYAPHRNRTRSRP